MRRCRCSDLAFPWAPRPPVGPTSAKGACTQRARARWFTRCGARVGPAPCRADEREAPDPARAPCCAPLNTVSPGAQEFTRCVARAVDPLMAAPGPEPWRDSGLERLYQGLPFWVNATANSTTAGPASTAASAPSGTPTAQVPRPHALTLPNLLYPYTRAGWRPRRQPRCVVRARACALAQFCARRLTPVVRSRGRWRRATRMATCMARRPRPRRPVPATTCAA
jgi:hypothetical protein